MVAIEDSGFSQEHQILTNINPFSLEQLVDLIEKVDKRNPFLDPTKDLVAVRRSHFYLGQIMEELSHYLLPNHKARLTEEKPYLLYHHPKRMCSLAHYLNTHPSFHKIIEVFARTKGPDDYVEKIARKLAKESSLVNPDYPRYLSVEDLYGLTLVTSTLQDCRDIKNTIIDLISQKKIPFLFDEEEDYYKQVRIKRSGHQEPIEPRSYKAIHHSLRWKNGIPELNGLRLEVQYVSRKDHEKNKNGGHQHPERAHLLYKLKKLNEPHTMGNYQVVILDHHCSPEEKDLDFIPQFIDLSCQKLNGRAHYHLLRPAA